MNNKTMTEIIGESFAQYAGAVAQSRAIVDVRDFMKPSARQINYCLYTDKFLPDKPFKKTLKAIGSIARMYIHGDASAEGVIMRSGQPFALRYPLMEIEGNGGNLQQSGNWAAPRYSGARLSNIGAMMFNDIGKDTIKDWRDNYDDTEQYPSVLPTKGFYNIVNGTSGIGTGIASSCPQFNLRDVNRALETLLCYPDCSFESIYCPPDFATGGYLINEKEVKEALKYGSKKNAIENGAEGASCKLRAKIDYDEKDNALIVTEIPYSVYTNTICGQLEEIVNDPESKSGIDRFNDLTGEQPLIKIYLKKGMQPDYVIDFLYENTSLQYHYGINMTMLENGKFPKVFTWKEALQAHIDHEKEVYRRGFNFDLAKIEKRIHILDGLLICMASIDEVVKTIKKSASTSEASKNLQERFLLDEEQAKAVLDMKLARLAHLEVEKLENEKESLTDEAKRIRGILSDENLFNQELIKGWREVSNRYGDDHRTKIITVKAASKEEKELSKIISEDVVVTITRAGMIKKVPTKNFRAQRRGGKGVKNEDDTLLDTIKTNTTDTLMLFTSAGNIYKALVDDIPYAENAKKGVPVSSLVGLESGEQVMAITSLHRKSIPKYIIFITKKGTIKKTLLEEYMKGRWNKGVKAILLKEDDAIAEILFQDDEELVLITKEGMSLRLKAKDINAIGRLTMGVAGINLNDGDEVVSAMSVHKETDQVAIFTSDGLGKRVRLSDFTTQRRNGKGVKLGRANSDVKVIGAKMVSDEDLILLFGNKTNICFKANEIPITSKNSIGNIMIKDNKAVSVIKM